jgi:hypothetical protein
MPRLGSDSALALYSNSGNALVAHLTVLFGRFRGVLISKVIAVGIAMGVRRLMWGINLIYIGIVGWNLITITFFALRGK